MQLRPQVAGGDSRGRRTNVFGSSVGTSTRTVLMNAISQELEGIP